jgi:RAB protein geranylgeranyltransferase component A
MISLNSQIELIMENFDFAKCQKVMKFLNWKWSVDPAARIRASISKEKKEFESQVPTEFELKKEARNLLNLAIEIWDTKNTTACVASGGLVAYVIRGELMLSFEIESRFGSP